MQRLQRLILLFIGFFRPGYPFPTHGHRVALFLLLLTGVILCGASPPRTVRVGAYENHPKIYTDQNGKIRGIFPELLEYIAAREGWKLEYIPGSWAESLERLENNEIDLMVDVAESDDRRQKYDFHDETVLINWGTVYTVPDFEIGSLFDLEGKRIAVMEGSIHTVGPGGIRELTDRFDIECDFIGVADYSRVFGLLDKKGADAGVVNRLYGTLFEKNYRVRKTPIVFNPRHLKFAFPGNSERGRALAERIDHHLRKLKDNPNSVYHRIMDVYLFGLPDKYRLTGTPPGELTKIPLTAREQEWIDRHPVIRLGIDPEFAPFEYIDEDGTYRGISSDYVGILNQSLGLRMEFVPGLSWTEAVEKARRKEIDVLPCVGRTGERLDFLLYSRPYVDFHRVIITRSDAPFIGGLNDITGQKVAVQAESSHEGFLKENTGIRPRSYKTLQGALEAVSGGGADVFIGNLASATYWIRKLNLTNLKVAAPLTGDPQSLYFAVRKDWPELVGLINKGLAAIPSGEKDQIHRHWVSVDYAPGLQPRLLRIWLVRIGGAAVAVVGLILIWNLKLKKEIDRRKKAESRLQKAKRAAESADHLKSVFLATMSHELRTPLNSIIGFTGIILQELPGPLNEEQRKQMAMVQGSARHLLALINDVLDISKIESGQLEITSEKFDLNEAVQSAVATVRPLAEKRGLSLTCRIDEGIGTIESDRRRVEQIIINLVNNAVKFTREGGVVVSVGLKGDFAVISVRDTGIGIKEEDMSKLFRTFQQIDTGLTREVEGTGLGLSICRKLVNILGGEIHAESRWREGSRFTFTLPYTKEQRDEDQSPDN